VQLPAHRGSSSPGQHLKLLLLLVSWTGLHLSSLRGRVCAVLLRPARLASVGG
jgi:hypothetical protein